MPILQWLDRDKHVRAADAVPYRLLEADDTHSAGAADTPNMIIQGDNLEALKALLPYYAGRVKCIYIDPPYNTRSAFEHYDDNLEHSQWLEMMYPRFQLLRELLSEDGFIFVQIDYRESAHLKVILDEIFGTACFKNEIIVGRGIKNVQSQFEDIDSLAAGHDTIYLYSKNARSRLKTLFAQIDDPQPGKWDTFWRGTERPTMRYELFGITPPRGQWRWSKDRAYHAKALYEKYMSDFQSSMSLDEFWKKLEAETGTEPNLVRLGSENTVQYYVGPRDYKMLSDVWLDIRTLGKITNFPHEKHEALLERIISWVTKPNEIVLDSFLGSGSTAAAAHKMRRHYIGIEMGEHAISHCVPRLKKIIDGNDHGGISDSVGWEGGGGFRFYKLGAPIFDTEGRINPEIRFAHLAAHVWFSETHTALHKKARSALLGSHNGTAYYLLYNGILGDKRPDGGNVLTAKVLAELPKHDGQKVIFGEACRISASRLKDLNIVFKQTPYDLKAR